MEKRKHRRKELTTIKVEELTALNNYNIVIQTGVILDASTEGILVEVERNDFSAELKANLTLEKLLGTHLALFLPQMGLDLDGYVMRTSHLGNGVFNVYIEFSSEVPDYWRDCLIDLLPSDEELDDIEFAS